MTTTSNSDTSDTVGGNTLVPGETLTTGELRAALQAIVFVRLAAYHGPGFVQGTIAAAQYWGAGKVVLTRFPDGATITLAAHDIRCARIQAIQRHDI